MIPFVMILFNDRKKQKGNSQVMLVPEGSVKEPEYDTILLRYSDDENILELVDGKNNAVVGYITVTMETIELLLQADEYYMGWLEKKKIMQRPVKCDISGLMP